MEIKESWEDRPTITFRILSGMSPPPPVHRIRSRCLAGSQSPGQVFTLVQWIRSSPKGSHLIHWTSASSWPSGEILSVRGRISGFWWHVTLAVRLWKHLLMKASTKYWLVLLCLVYCQRRETLHRFSLKTTVKSFWRKTFLIQIILFYESMINMLNIMLSDFAGFDPQWSVCRGIWVLLSWWFMIILNHVNLN